MDTEEGSIKRVPVHKGRPVFRVDKPDSAAGFPHVKFSNRPEQHYPISSTTLRVAQNFKKIVATVKTAAIVTAVASDGYSLYQAVQKDGGKIGANTIATAGGIAGSWTGAYVGSKIGGALGAAIGQVLIPLPGLGAAIGGAVGGFAGGILGSIIGRAAGQSLAASLVGAKITASASGSTLVNCE